jgi:hypothetical protein
MLKREGRLTQWQEGSLEEAQELYIKEADYYERVFQNIREIKHRVDAIQDKIATYERYHYRYETPTIISLIVMAISGVVVPFTMLFLFKLPSITQWVVNNQTLIVMVTALIFALFTVLTISLIYLDITTS